VARGKVWIGLDVGAELTSVSVLTRSGEILHEQRCGSSYSEVRGALRGFGPRRTETVAIEAGSFSMDLCRTLRAAGYPVRILETRTTSKFLAYNRNKTDSNDARGLAEAARLGRTLVPEVRLKTIQCQTLRSRLVLRHRMTQQRVSLQLAVRSIFRLYGMRVRGGKRLSTEASASLMSLQRQQGIDLSADVAPLLEMIDWLLEYLKRIDLELLKIAKEHPVCSRFMEVPGVGHICALSIFTALENESRFTQARDVGPFLGLVPRLSQSGQMLRSGRISRMGNGLTRLHLNMAASVLLFCTKRNSALRDWGIALAERRGRGKARTAVARKIAVMLLAMWKNGSHYQPYPAD
jgi:transposase